MKILRWLLCHLLSITLLASFVLIFSFRDVLKDDFNNLTGKSSRLIVQENASDWQGDAAQAAAPSVADETGQEKPAETVQAVTESAAERNAAANSEVRNTGTFQYEMPVSSSEPLPGGATDATNDPWDNILANSGGESKVAASAGDANTLPEPESNFPPENYDPEESGAESVTSKDTGLKYPGNSDVFRSTPAATVQSSSLPRQAGMPAAVNSSAGESKYFQVLEETRKLYWDGKSAPAQAAYEKLMFEYPEQPEAPAELGNLFLQQGNRKGASWAYQNAIPRYLNLHREQEAINLIRFISQYEPAIAESLQKKYW